MIISLLFTTTAESAAYTKKRVYAAFVRLLFMILFVSILCARTQALCLNAQDSVQWSGVPVSFTGKEKCLFLQSAGGTCTEIDTNGEKSLLLYFDAGNYSGKGKGTVSADCLDESGNVIFSFDKLTVTDDGNFRRYNIGTSELYAGIPEGTARIKLTITALSGGSGPYFRNINVVFSSSSGRDMSIKNFSESGAVGLVEVNSTDSDHWIMVALIFAIALAMLGIRKYLDKVKKRRL